MEGVPDGNEPVSTAAWKDRLAKWAERGRLWQHEDQILLLLTLIIGAVVGLVVVAFILLTENLGARMYPPGGAAWRRLIVPVVGALGTGWFLWRYFPDARGSGIPQTKAALFLQNGFISFRTVLGKFSLCSVSLASGIALGREGPAVQVGAGIASVLGRQLGLSRAKIRSLLPVGASAALAAAFNTPISAVLFSLEEVMGDMHAPVLGSIVLSSATSWIVLHLLLGDEPLFHVPAYQLVHPVEFIFYGILGVAGGLVSVVFVKLLLGIRKGFSLLPRNKQWLYPAAGGLLVGVLGWFVPEVLGVGYANVSRALNGQLLVGTMGLLVLLKVVATASCYGSGNAGGIFGPSLFIGAMMGGAVGGTAHMLAPDYTGSVGAYALVGMGAAFAGIVRVPLTSVIMIFEVTRDYSIIVPLMISNLISYLISSRFQKEPIYEALQHQDGIHLPAGPKEREDLLVVSQGIRRLPQVLPPEQTVEQALASVDKQQRAWPVAGEAGLVGMITLSNLELAAGSNPGARVDEAIEAGLRTPIAPHVYPDQPLDTAMRRMAESGVETLPVVSRANFRQLVGVISLDDVLTAYGLREGQEQAAEPEEQVRSTRRKLAGVLTAILAALVITVFLTYFYRTQSGERANRYFQAGNQFMSKERYPEAIEQYRNALSISHTPEYRLALAVALVKAERMNEAEIYLRELLRSQPNSGAANLAMARALASRGETPEAMRYYHRAMYGSWPHDVRQTRAQVGIELVEMLGRAGQKRQAQAELLALVAELPDDLTSKKRVGNLLIQFGLPKEASGLFRDLVHRDKADIEAWRGLAEAEFALGDYRSARDDYRNVLLSNVSDQQARQRIEVCDRILSLDPTVRRLRTAERFARSKRLIENVLSAVGPCMGATMQPEVEMAFREARDAVSSRRNPPSLGDAADSNIVLAEELWRWRTKLCNRAEGFDEALSRVMDRLAR